MNDPVQDLKDKQIQKLKDLTLSYVRFAASEDGKAILEDLAAICNARRSSFSDVPGRTEFNEGARAVWLHIERRIRQYDNPKENQNGKS